jgi:rhodanese-related sulfurtransferase
MLRIYSLDSGLRKETLMPGNLRIIVDEVRKRMGAGEQFAFIDTRNPQAWGESDVKLPGAIRLLVDKLEEHISEIPKDRPIVAYCT